MNVTKRGNKYSSGIPVYRRKAHRGYRNQFEDRRQKRLNDINLKFDLQKKIEKGEPLTKRELSIYAGLQKMSSRDEFEARTDVYRTLCLRCSFDRLNPLQFKVQSKVVPHPQDRTFTKKVKVLNDKGKSRLNFLKRKKAKEIQKSFAEVVDAKLSS